MRLKFWQRKHERDDLVSERLGRLEAAVTQLAVSVHEGFARIERKLGEDSGGSYYVPIPRPHSNGNGGPSA